MAQRQEWENMMLPQNGERQSPFWWDIKKNDLKFRKVSVSVHGNI